MDARKDAQKCFTFGKYLPSAFLELCFRLYEQKNKNSDRVFLPLDDLPPALIAKLRKAARTEGKTFDEYVEQVLTRGIARLEQGDV